MVGKNHTAPSTAMPKSIPIPAPALAASLVKSAVTPAILISAATVAIAITIVQRIAKFFRTFHAFPPSRTSPCFKGREAK